MSRTPTVNGDPINPNGYVVLDPDSHAVLASADTEAEAIELADLIAGFDPITGQYAQETVVVSADELDDENA